MKDLCLVHYTSKIAPMVFRENIKQLEKWGVQDHTPFEWLAYTTEELGELSKAISEWKYRGGLIENIVKEAIETATLSLKIAEMFNNLLIIAEEEEQKTMDAQHRSEADAQREAEDKAIAEFLVEQEQEYRLGGEAND